MQKRVWVFQYKKDVERLGDAAPWYVGWYSSDDKRKAESCGAGAKGRKLADKKQRQKQSELDTGTERVESKKKWDDFVAEYEADLAGDHTIGTIQQVRAALKHFKRITGIRRVSSVDQAAVNKFRTARQKERGKKPGSTISPATVNKDLRTIKAALRFAHECKYLPEMPRIRMVREPVKLPTYVTPEHFATIYNDACQRAAYPSNPQQHYTACDWWRALVVTCYMTGMRIHEVLAIRKADLNLDSGKLVTRHSDNKGRRDEIIPLHPIVIEHLRKIVSLHSLVFQWAHGDRLLWDEFGRIQREAGISLPCREQHEHTAACHVYGFHDFRRAFATVNASRMKPEALQRLMRHKSYQTTLCYINLASQLDDAVAAMPVPLALQGTG